LGEARCVFLQGNHLPDAWRGNALSGERFVVSELGFGTGLNALALAQLVQQQRALGVRVPELVYQSVELYPRPVSVYLEHVTRWPELEPFAKELQACGPPVEGWNTWALSWATLRLYIGDAADLSVLKPTFEPTDAWFLDGYAPAQDTALWEPELLAWVGRTTVSGGTASTYSAAGVVKQALRAAGFEVVRRPGWGKKRHRLEARFNLY
jgi:tRNA 5-methylaminomethyl-2-thiouridine biosynthesis bifunctional protein